MAAPPSAQILTPGPATATFVAPTVDALIRIEGTPATAEFIAPDPVLLLELVLTPDPASAEAIALAVQTLVGIAPRFIHGGVASGTFHAPDLIREVDGECLLQPDVATATFSAPALSALAGARILTPGPAVAEVVAVGGELELEGLVLLPDVATAEAVPVGLTRTEERFILAGTASASFAAPDPLLERELVLTPSPATTTALATLSEAKHFDAQIQPLGLATCQAVAPGPTLVFTNPAEHRPLLRVRGSFGLHLRIDPQPDLGP